MSSEQEQWPFGWGRPAPTRLYSDDELDEAWRELNSHVVDDPQPLQFAVSVNCTGLRETYAALAALMDQVSETMRAGCTAAAAAISASIGPPPRRPPRGLTATQARALELRRTRNTGPPPPPLGRR